MASYNEIAARANALLMVPNTEAFHYGVVMLRNAITGSEATFHNEIRSCAIGLLSATSDAQMQAGIAALAQMLGVEDVLLAQRPPMIAVESHYWQLPEQRGHATTVTIDAPSREVTR